MFNIAHTIKSGLVAGVLLMAAQPASAATVIAAFGDSITRGFPYYIHNFNGARGGAYPNRLENLLREHNPDANAVIHNWAIGGESTYGAVNRISAVLASSRPQWILIMTGTNDLWTGISPQSTAANISRMIDRSRGAGAQPVVANLTPSYYPGHRGDRISSQYNPAIESIIQRKEVIFNDAYRAFASDWSALTYDGLHMNSAGYRLLAETWCDVMTLCRARRPDSLPWLDVLLFD